MSETTTGLLATRRNVATLDRMARLGVGHRFAGKRVELVRRYCGNETTVRGTVQCVALSHGGGADVLVLLADGCTLPDAYSLAQVRSIRELQAVCGYHDRPQPCLECAG